MNLMNIQWNKRVEREEIFHRFLVFLREEIRVTINLLYLLICYLLSGEEKVSPCKIKKFKKKKKKNCWRFFR
jgi:hypothetical protein